MLWHKNSIHFFWLNCTPYFNLGIDLIESHALVFFKWPWIFMYPGRRSKNTLVIHLKYLFVINYLKNVGIIWNNNLKQILKLWPNHNSIEFSLAYSYIRNAKNSLEKGLSSVACQQILESSTSKDHRMPQPVHTWSNSLHSMLFIKATVLFQ